ncbi:hypothetical protein [Desulfogranum marinum]|uniref:hypothetical protein n=1 Tax=Desulfogranum marinum TaxID=453220 RepID=UPI001963C0B7|nr:hypothetical protein [Desulfogranum marinum]MBM9514035.1 hypothetical protein [Desulfogranum marinum]
MERGRVLAKHDGRAVAVWHRREVFPKKEDNSGCIGQPEACVADEGDPPFTVMTLWGRILV